MPQLLSFFTWLHRWYSAVPSPEDDQEEQRPVGNPRINQLVEEICSMNLLEVSDLIDVLRKRLNITAPVGGGYPMGIYFLCLPRYLCSYKCHCCRLYTFHMARAAFSGRARWPSKLHKDSRGLELQVITQSSDPPWHYNDDLIPTAKDGQACSVTPQKRVQGGGRS